MTLTPPLTYTNLSFHNHKKVKKKSKLRDRARPRPKPQQRMVKHNKVRPAVYNRKNGRAMPRSTFVRLIKEITNEVSLSEHPLKWSKEGIDGLQEATEAYVEKHFARANKLLDTFDQRTLSVKHFNSACEVTD